MLELTLRTILIGSILAMGFIVARKTPTLKELPETGQEFPEKKSEVLNKVFFKTTSLLKIFWRKLKNLKREKGKEEKEVKLSDDYWKKIRRG